MLIYHFGSREGLLIEVIRTVEDAAARGARPDAADEPEASPAETMRRMWRRVADPALWPNERLFFEVYAQALQGSPHARPLLDGIVDPWVEPLARLAVAQGRPEAEARAEARLGVAVVRGLLLDLLATGDRDGGRRGDGALHRGDRARRRRRVSAPEAGFGPPPCAPG